MWFRSVIIGLLKKGKDGKNPDSYRIIALESCVLKVITLLIHKRITDWADARGLIPDYQNGFREGYRTNNNPFILRCVKEWACAKGLTIYVAAIDATNAFPSTDHPTLWLKLLRMGMGGALFDWLRMLYQRMEYYVRHGDRNSTEFKAFIGLLTGDPASPVLWNLFMADLIMPDDVDDVILTGVRMTIPAQADDILLISTSAEGLQRRLNTLDTWCSRNFIVVNMIKTIIMIFGRAPTDLLFKLGENILAITVEEKYVGMNFRTDTRNMFADHYKAKASTARYCAHRIMGLEDSTGRLTPKELKTLYMARVDCHLIHGCEVSPDCEDVHVKELCAVQVDFLRQMLNVHSQSMHAPLFTETGIMPLRPRRFMLLLVYLQHLLSLPLPHFARAALDSSIELAAIGKKSWAGDVLIAATKLPFECPPLDLASATPTEVEEYRKDVETRALQWLQHEVDTSVKLYLLHGRREPQKDKPAAQKTLYLRHYLFMVKTQEHREALTSIMLFTHQLALEKLRHTDHAHPPVPRHERLCRFCTVRVESPEHALLECQASPVVLTLRNVFLEKLFHTVPKLQSKMVQLDSIGFLKAMIYERATIVLVGKYVYDVLQIFYGTPVYRPIASRTDF
jgi:hypothetical protein